MTNNSKLLTIVAAVSVFFMIISVGIAGYFISKKDDDKSDNKKDQKTEITTNTYNYNSYSNTYNFTNYNS